MAHDSDYSHIYVGSTGITTQEIASALGVSSRSVGTLCTHANVNKWSKAKPFDSNTVAFASDAARQAAIAAVNYGFSLAGVMCTSISSFRSTYATEWPCSGPTHNYRMLDFNGYRTGKWNMGVTGGYLAGPFGITLSTRGGSATTYKNEPIYLGVTKDSTDGLIYLEDFNHTTWQLKNWRIGVVVMDSSSNFYVYITSYTTTTFEEVGTMDWDLPSLANGSYYLMPILTNAPANNAWATSWDSNYYICSIDGKYIPITIATKPSTMKQVTLSGTYTAGSNWSIAVSASITYGGVYSGVTTYIKINSVVDDDGTTHALLYDKTITIASGSLDGSVTINMSDISMGSSIPVGGFKYLYIEMDNVAITYSTTPSNPIDASTSTGAEIDMW